MRPSLAALLTAVIVVALICVYPARMIMPGPLSPGHAKLANDCLGCHQVLSGPATSTCVSCHALERIGTRPEALRPGLASFHKTLQDRRCFECHVVHGSERVQRRGGSFDHKTLPADLAKGCVTCHRSRTPADDMHRSAGEDCARCHQPTGWRGAKFDHDRYFRFDSHHPPQCASCHTQPQQRTSYTCTGCHEHSPDRMVRKHRSEGILAIQDCARCHRSGDEHEAEGGGRSGEKRSRGKGEGKRERTHERDDD